MRRLWRATLPELIAPTWGASKPRPSTAPGGAAGPYPTPIVPTLAAKKSRL